MATMIHKPTRAQIAEEIRDLRAEANRLPFRHQRRVKMERRIDALVDRWIAADG